MAKKIDRETQKQSLKDLLASQIAPASSYRLIQLIGDGSPLKGLSIGDLDKLAEEMAAQSEGIKRTSDGSLRLYSLSGRFLTSGSAERYKNRLEAIDPGPGDNARAFENWCSEVLHDLLGDTLDFLPEQTRTDGGSHRLDFCAAVRPGHRFWDRLRDDYKSRYIVFEFKNGKGALAPENVAQAAGYLSPHASRMVCILISRHALLPGTPAFDAAESRNRAEQKLVLGISTLDLISMVKGKETGRDPAILLNQRLDIFLRESKP